MSRVDVNCTAARTADARPGIGIVVVAGGVALVASHLSPYTRGEVERIWLPFFPWIAVAAATTISPTRRLRSGMWVGAQALTAIALQSALVTKW